jgi:hypothetical protein
VSSPTADHSTGPNSSCNPTGHFITRAWRARQLVTCTRHGTGHPNKRRLVSDVNPPASCADSNGLQNDFLNDRTLSSSKLCRLAKGSRSRCASGAATCKHSKNKHEAELL